MSEERSGTELRVDRNSKDYARFSLTVNKPTRKERRDEH